MLSTVVEITDNHSAADGSEEGFCHSPGIKRGFTFFVGSTPIAVLEVTTSYDSIRFEVS